MAHPNAEIQEVADADNNERETTSIVLDLEYDLEIHSQRVEALKVELENARAVNHERSIQIILLDLLAGRRRSIADLPADVRDDLGLLVDSSLKAARECLEKLRRLKVEEGSPAPPPPPVGEAYVEPPAVTEFVVAQQAAAEGAPLLGLPAVSSPPDAPAPDGEHRN